MRFDQGDPAASDDASGGPDRRRRFARLRGTAARQHYLAVIEQGVSGATNFLTVVIVGRFCGAEELGLFSLGLTICFLLISVQEALVTIPLTVYLPRLRPGAVQQTRGSAIQSGVMLAGLSGTIILMTAWVLYLASVSPSVVAVAAALGPAAVGFMLRDLARRMAFAELRVRSALVISSTVLILLVTTMTIWILYGKLTATTALASLALANVLSAAIWFATIRQEVLFDREDLRLTTRRHWKMGKMLLASHLVSSGAQLSLPWLIAASLGTGPTGFFAACESLIRLANPMISGITSVLTPRAAKAYAEGGVEHLRSVLLTTGWILGAFLLAFCVVIAVAGKTLLLVTYGVPYSQYATVLLILAIAKAVHAMSLPAGRGLLVYERVASLLMIDAISCALTISLTLVLVHSLGIMGAAVGALAFGISVLSLETIMYCRYSRLPNPSSGELESPNETGPSSLEPELAAEIAPVAGNPGSGGVGS